jgi:hypothetical protein
MPTTIAIDVAKSIFDVAVSEHPGRVCERHRLTRAQFARFVATRPAATSVMEACGRRRATHGSKWRPQKCATRRSGRRTHIMR